MSGAVRPAPAPHILDLLDRSNLVAYELVGVGDPAWLLPEEEADVDGASAGRRAEFASGRACARAGLAELGLLDVPVRRGERREPRWPAGTTGSITHTARHRDGSASDPYCLAVVGPSRDEVAIGIDAEVLGRVTADLHHLVFTDREQEWLDELAESDRAELATAVFSGKEAFYKAQHTFTGAWVGFHDVTTERTTPGRLRLEATAGFPALDRVVLPTEVRWLERDGLVVSGVVVERVGSDD